MDDDWCNAMIEASDTHGVGDEMVTSHQAEEAKPATFDTDELWEDAMIDQASQTSVGKRLRHFKAVRASMQWSS